MDVYVGYAGLEKLGNRVLRHPNCISINKHLDTGFAVRVVSEVGPYGVATGIAVPAEPVALLSDVRELIQQARKGVARAIDSGLVALHWHVGRRIRQDILKEKRTEYGQKIVSVLGTQLSADFGRGFDEQSLRHMVRFAEVFPDEQIVSALRRQLIWTLFKRVISIFMIERLSFQSMIVQKKQLALHARHSTGILPICGAELPMLTVTSD